MSKRNKCIVESCRYKMRKHLDRVLLHRFPDSTPERELWLEAIGQPNTKLNSASRICSSHFEQKHLLKLGDKYVLSRLAVPKISTRFASEFSNEESAVEEDSQEPIVPGANRAENTATKGSACLETEDLTVEVNSSPRKSFAEPSVPICCIQSCPSNKQNAGVVRLFTVPDDAKRRSTWTHILSDDHVKFVKGSRICHRHFEERYIVKGGSYIGQDGVEKEYENMNWRLTEDAVPSTTLIEHSVKEKVIMPRLPEKKFKVEKTCRTCSIEIEKENDATPLFTGSLSLQKFRPDIYKELEEFGLKIEENDGLPQQICQKCLQSFSILIQFRKQCQRVQIDLVKYFKDSKQQRMRSSDSGVITLCDNYSDDEGVSMIHRNSVDLKNMEDSYDNSVDIDDDDIMLDDILSENEQNLSDEENSSANWTCEYYIRADEKTGQQRKNKLKRKAEVAEDEKPDKNDKNSSKVLSIITHHTPVPYDLDQSDTKKQRKRCKLCQRLTLHCCESCPEEPRLCLEPCFAAYHDSAKQMQLKQNDGLPQKICFSCLKTLAVISEFRKRCKDVQTILRFYHKSVPTTSTRKKSKSGYAEKIEQLKKANIASGCENLEDFIHEETKNSYAEKIERLKNANVANWSEQLEDFVLGEIKKEEEEIEQIRTPFLNGRQFSSKDERSAVVRLKRMKMKNLESISPNWGDEESSKSSLCAHNGSKDGGNQVGNLEQVSTASIADNYDMKTESDLILENEKYEAEITDVEFLDEKFLNEIDSRTSEQDLVLISSDDDIEEFNLNETNWQCEFSIETNDGEGDIAENEMGETTITKKRKIENPVEKSQCPFCLDYFQVVISHMRRCTRRPAHICKFCDLAFETSSELNDHIEKMHSEGLPACHIYFASFDNFNQRAEHIRREHKKIEFKCDKCDRVFSKKHFLAEHMERRHTEIINKKCSMCRKVLKTEFLFQRHLKQHEMADRLKCQFCGKMFSRKQFKLIHERLHTGERPYLCEVCGLGFPSLVDLNVHKKRIHYGDGREYRPRKRMLWRQKQEAAPEPLRFKCAFCPRDFGTSYGLDQHLKKHTEDRKFNCGQCGNGFNRLVHLKMHELRMHIKEKRFTCPECGKMFYEKSELNFHSQIHQEERHLQCPHCPAKFKQQKRLKAHLASHSSERPYVCHCCGNAYKFSTNLQAHFQSHTAEEIKELERKLVCDMEENFAANKILEIEHENMIEESELEQIEFDCSIENQNILNSVIQ